MPQGDRCLLVHGHFYQPPRENPWTGQIDPQHSAAPWENWNRRIADECYIPMARSRIFDSGGRIVDLYNNYAHTSFNFGPTLLSWLDGAHPGLIRHLRDAAAIDRTFAMAQAYNHMMLPLADARDRHVQIVWGLREFHHRFGFRPRGMWLPECGIDAETTRALIDHGVEFVILSPHQASKARPFGARDWREASMGAIDTRRAYRMFETDGGGRTHFDRHLDVIFYTPGLNLKVSFDHILNRPADLARELESCFVPGRAEAQLVSIVTDGEIYGHHEKRGGEALSRLFGDIAPAIGLKVVSAGEFIRDNPPAWEVKLWNGEDGNGTSWSCEHGMGRWSRDCGCRPPTPPGWNQDWRGPLRSALDAVRDRVRGTVRRELGGLVHDVDDAGNDYISVILDPSPGSRRRFIGRHAQRPLLLPEIEKLWRLLESLHQAMLMYTSCGWFFDELSGLEPVQNMRYALRAAELAQPWHDGDLVRLLEGELTRAKSNIRHFTDGGGVFRELVLPSRHSGPELAAALAVCLAAGFPADCLSWRPMAVTEPVRRVARDGGVTALGSFVCHDPRLDRFVKASWLTRLNDSAVSGTVLCGFEEAQGDPFRADGQLPFGPDADFSWTGIAGEDAPSPDLPALAERFGTAMVRHDRLPGAVRDMLYRRFSREEERKLLGRAADLGVLAAPFMARARRYGARVPDSIAKTVAYAFGERMTRSVHDAVGTFALGDGAAEEAARHLDAARELGLSPGMDAAERAVCAAGLELLHWLSCLPEPNWVGDLRTRELPDGGKWICPLAPANHSLCHPAASELSLALGKGLAAIRGRLLATADPTRGAIDIVPLPELLEYAGRLGLDTRGMAELAMEYWDFLGRPLSRLIAADPAGMMSGGAGDRVRRVGLDLGFSRETVERRIIAAARTGNGA